MYRSLAALAVSTAALALPAAAGGQPTWNQGYGWWPGGYGNPPATTQASTKQCSVSAMGPTFDSTLRQQIYGASTSCQGGVGLKQLGVVEEVRGQNGVWYRITGTRVVYAPTYRNPVRIERERGAVLGHTYRVVAKATIQAPNGHAGCSLTNTCTVTYRLTAISKPIAP